MDKGSCVRAVPSSSRNYRLGGTERVGRKSDAIPGARHGRLDPAVSCHHFGGITAAQNKNTWPDTTDSLPPDAGPVRFLLRLLALQYLYRPRPGARFSWCVGRHREAALHNRGIHGICLTDSAGDHLHCWNGSADGLSSLAAAASLDLRERGSRSDPFLLARKIRRPSAAYLRRNYGGSLGLA